MDTPVYLVTVTAPGVEVLPFSGDGVTCSRPELEEWCETLPARWKALRNAASRGVRRKGLSSPILALRWDLQRRGAPHVHLVVAATEAGVKFAERLAILAPNHSFGFVDTKLRNVPAYRAGSYLTSYLVNEGAGHFTSAERKRYLPSHQFFVSRRLTEQTGMKLRTCKLIRQRWKYGQGSSLYPRFESEYEQAVTILYYFRRSIEGADLARFSKEKAARWRPSLELEADLARAEVSRRKRSGRALQGQLHLDL